MRLPTTLPVAAALALATAAFAPVSVAHAQARGHETTVTDRQKAQADTVRGGVTAAVATTSAPAPAPANPTESRPGDNFYRAQREIPVGNWGIGYELSIRFSLKERRVYGEDFDTAREMFNQLAFLRFGVEGRVGRPYIRVGVLDTARLGYGQVLAFYDNTPLGSLTPKRGLEAGMNFGRAGFEVLTGNLEKLEVVGARAYVKPLSGTVGGKLGDFQLGFTGATDFAPGAGYTEIAFPRTIRLRSGAVGGTRYPRPTMYGADATLPLVRRDGTELLTYVDVARLRHGGHGGVLALQVNQRVRNSSVMLKYEHREVSNGYRAGYFDNTYEQQRAITGVAADPRFVLVATRYLTTLNSTSGGPAAWIETRAQMPRWSLWSIYTRQYRDSRSGWLHLELDSRTFVPRVSTHLWYDKWRVDGARDFIRLDDRAAIQGAAALRLFRNTHLFALSRLSFVPVKDAAGAVTGFKTLRYGEKRVTLRLPF